MLCFEGGREFRILAADIKQINLVGEPCGLTERCERIEVIGFDARKENAREERD